MRWLPNILTLARVPVIVLLVLPAFSLESDSPELAFWLYIAGLLSHGLDGALARKLKHKPRPQGFWHQLDTVFLSLGLQIAAAVWLVNADVFPWWIILIYLVMAGIAEFGYTQPRKTAGRPFKLIVLRGSGVVWALLAALLAYQAFQTVTSILVVDLALFVYVLIHINSLHPELWDRWYNTAEAKT